VPTLPLSWFQWLDVNLPGSVFLRESTYGFSVSLTLHVLSMCVFFGLVMMMDLRLVGIGHHRTHPADIQKRLFPWQMFGFVVVTITGVVLWWAKPLTYYGKGFFWIKMALMLLAGVNAGLIHVITHRAGGTGWDSTAAKVAGGLSILLWTGILIFGRLIAYPWLTYEHY
jgi:hypothetical protein